MLTLESLTHPSNVLELTNPGSFLNTTTMAGVCFSPGNWCSDAPGPSNTVLVNVEPSYFSGYVFRGDIRPPTLIFKCGFELQAVRDNEEAYAKRMIGASAGVTSNYGISTSVCASVCGPYSFKASREDPFSPGKNSGFVYLIDATTFKGFAIPSPRPGECLVAQNPVLKDIYEVNFPSCIPGCYIVGIVWVLGKQNEGLENCQGFWLHNPSKLWLAVNPYFEKNLFLTDDTLEGMEAAKYVVRLFNDCQLSTLLGLAGRDSINHR